MILSSRELKFPIIQRLKQQKEHLNILLGEINGGVVFVTIDLSFC